VLLVVTSVVNLMFGLLGVFKSDTATNRSGISVLLFLGCSIFDSTAQPLTAPFRLPMCHWVCGGPSESEEYQTPISR
jgi:hypothetical protein